MGLLIKFHLATLYTPNKLYKKAANDNLIFNMGIFLWSE